MSRYPKRGYLFAAEVVRDSEPPPTPTSNDIAQTLREGGGAPAPTGGEPPTVVPTEAAERRHLTVLCCDLVDSTALSARLDAEALQDVLTAYRGRVTEAIRSEDGHIANFMGDGVFAYFGWPRAHEDDAERAIRAGLGAAAAVAALGTETEPLAARVGIASGLVVVGELAGAGEVRVSDAVGGTPNLAARLQALAEPGSVVLDATTRQLAGRLFDYADMGEAVLKGFAMPVQAWRALGEGAPAGRFEALRGVAGAAPPLVGREEELSLLLRRWRQAAGSEGRVVLLSGEPGIGKSRLAAVLADSLAAEGAPHQRISWYCSPQHTGSVLHPVTAWLGRVARLARGDSPAQSAAKLEALLAPSGAAPEDLALLADLLGVPVSDRWQSKQEFSPQRRRERALATLLRQMEAFSQREPVLAVVEDAHWADPSTRELLDLLVARVEGMPVLLVVTYRPEFQAHWIGQAHVTTLPLSRLGRRESTALVAHVAGGRALPAALADHVIARADGVPLFVEELTKAVLEGGLTGAGGGTQSDIPATLRASLAARLDHHPRARRAAQFGAVIGRSFPHDLVAGLSGGAPVEVEEGLERLVSAGLVLRRGAVPDAVYTFNHALLHEAAYDSLLKSRRRALHGKVLRLLEERRPEIAEREPETLARHAALAGETITAARHLLRAGLRAMRGYALAEAEAHFSTGLDLLGGKVEDDLQRILQLDLQIALAQTVMGSRGFGDAAAGRAFDRALELSESVDDSERTFSVLHGRFMFHLVGGRPALALAAAERMLEIGGRTDGRHLLFAGQFFAAWPEFHMGRFAAALEHLRAASMVCGPDSPGYVRLGFVSDLRAMLAAYQAWMLLVTGEVEAADLADREAWAAAEGSRATSANAGAFCFSCLYSLLRGDALAAARKIRPTIAFCTEQRYSYWLAAAAGMQALCIAEEGRVAEAVAMLRRALEAYRATGSSVMTAFMLGTLARLLTRLGRTEEALGTVAEALDTAWAADDRWYEAELHRIRGEAFGAVGDRNAAETELRKAVSVAQTQGATLWELRAALHLTPLLVDREARHEAHDLLTKVIGRMPAGSSAPEMREARALLDTLYP
ncbi:AAA family ATPase [Paracraurococcus lichenis]|uniref:AAA family ATPase n=1 Tax=Paracraurococcus lichenis TaxID=3064888 RepID=A0ABT9EC96_9PROT|nr:AAA family ATPase [Paracraurococcus sp. LOR1-02]MDO9713837.1 AAA family ATPase [Paracraurococcus sp. LOR1-02]